MATTPNSTTFYVYALARPVKKDWRIFYIGKGSKRRMFAHEGEAKQGCACHKCRTIRKVWREGGEIQRYILLTTEDEQESFAYEREMIALHRRENLCNQTDGGEGVSGLIVTPETAAKRGAGIKRSWQREDVRKRRSEGIKAAKATPEAKARSRANGQKALSTPEQRQAKSDHMCQLWSNPEWRSKQTKLIHESNIAPERKEKIRRAGTGRVLSAETRSKISARLKGKTKTISEETRRKIGAALKGRKGRIPSESARQKMRAAKARAYLVTLPNGDQITILHLKTFCEEHGLNYGSVKGYISHGKGYKGYRIERQAL